MTIWPAWQHFEEDRKGTIEVGKLADFVILSADPTAVDPETLADLDVLVTIKEDKIIYEAAGSRHRTASRYPGTAAGHDMLHVLYEALK